MATNLQLAARKIASVNPATGEIVGHVELATAAGVMESASRARESQRAWKDKSFKERARIIRRFHDLMLDRSEAILDVIQSETGKARRDALAEIVTVAGTARYYLSRGAEHLQARRRLPAVPAITFTEYSLCRAVGIASAATRVD